MDSLYLLMPPDEPPSPPEYWSWSSLSEWRQCPRRWWLRRCKYPNVDSLYYPTWASTSALHGILVHDTLEEYSQRRRDGSVINIAEFDAYHFTKTRLQHHLSVFKTNPRVNSDNLAAAFSLDNCLGDFFRIARQLPDAATIQAGNDQSLPDGDRPPRYAEEHTLRCDDPDLTGRLDQVHDRVLVDFKTGDPDTSNAEEHESQLRHYAVIWWRRYGEIPAGLELRYADGSVRHVAMPDASTLSGEAQSIRTELEATAATLNRQTPPEANTDVETCQYCRVRQMCNDYWLEEATLPLRSVPTQTDSAAASFCDVRITEFPHSWTPGTHLVGQAVSPELGSIQLSIPAAKCPSNDQPAGTEMRILGASVTRADTEVRVKSTARSEVFWTVNASGMEA